MTGLYFVRHGLTANNKERRFNGSRSNSSLLEEGVFQAEQLGKQLREIAFTKAYVSPAIRAKETLSAILKENQKGVAELVETDLLKELDFGDWDGVLVKDYLDHPQFTNLMKFPAQYDPKEFGGETYQELLERGKKFVESLDFKQSENYLIVGHGIMLTTLLHYLNGKDLDHIRERGLLDNTSLSIFETTDGKEFQQVVWNSTEHLQNNKA